MTSRCLCSLSPLEMFTPTKYPLAFNPLPPKQLIKELTLQVLEILDSRKGGAF